MLNLLSIIKGLLIQNDTDRTIEVAIEADVTSTPGTRTTLKAKQTNNISIYLPDADDTLVGKATIDVLTNKSIDADTNTVTNIENADIKASAGIDTQKLSTGVITNTEFDNLNGIGSKVVGESDINTLTNKTIDADLNTVTNIDNADIKVGAAIDATKIGNGDVDNTELSRLNGLTGDIQTQLDAKIDDYGAGVDNSVMKSNAAGDAVERSGVLIDDLNNVVIPGDLTVNGTTVTVNTANLDVTDKNITVNNTGSDVSAEGAGLTVERVGTDGSLVYEDALTSKFKIGALGSEVEVADISSAQTITNKTIDADNNTISNLAHGAEVDNPTSGVHGVTGNVVGTSDIQDLSGKTFTDAVIIEEQAVTPATPAAGDKKIYPKTDGKLYTLNSAGEEVEVGSGVGQGSVNYIINPDAETNVSDVTSSVNVTLTPTVVDIIRGTQSFNSVYSSSATVADYTQWAMNDVDLVDLGKELTISFEYSADAGVSTGDFEVVVRNLDSATDITILDPELSFTGGHGSPTKFVGKFQTDGVDNTYALRIRPTFSFGTARTLKVDNVQVGPDKLLPSLVKKDLALASGTEVIPNVTNQLFDPLTASIDTVGGMGTDRYTFQRNGNFTISGVLTCSSSSTAFRILYYSVNGGVLTRLLSMPGTSGTNTIHSFEKTLSFNKGDYVQFTGRHGTGANETQTLEVKIEETDQRSNLISTQENLFSTVTTKANRATSTQNLTAGVFTKILFNAKSIDKFNNFDTTLGRFTASKSGNYSVTSGLSYNGPAANQVVDVVLRKNGTAISWARSQAIGGVSGGTNDTFQINLIKGDYIEIWVACPQVLGILSSATINGGSFMTVQEIPDFSVFGVTGETELIEASIGAFPWSSTGAGAGAWGDVLVLSLAPGEYDIDYQCVFSSTGASTAALVGMGVHNIVGPVSPGTSGVHYQDQTMVNNAPNRVSLSGTRKNVVITSTESWYLKGIVTTSTSFISAAGKISARRIK